MTWHDVGGEDEQAPGEGRAVSAGGLRVALFRTESGWTAFEDRCPHAGAPISDGVLRAGHVVCAWHGWRFDAATGACPLFAGAPALRPVPVRVTGRRVEVGVAQA